VVWYDLSIGNRFKVKYTPIKPTETEYPDVDEKGNPLKRISGTFTKGYFINEQTGERHEKAFKLINGQASSGWTGRIKAVDEGEYIFVDEKEADDLIVEHTFLVESQRLFDELKAQKQALIFAGWYGNGYKVYKCYITPSEIYEGWCLMRCGTAQLSEQIGKAVGELTEMRELRKRLEQIELNSKKVNNVKASDMIKLKK
jgi:hypothetical protein